MKKTISVILVLVLLLSTMSLSAFAFEDDFDINDITWDDILSMNSTEFRELLADFERVYDPFGTYETNPIMEQNQKNNNEPQIQPYWTSGKYDEGVAESGSHELITAKACGVLMKDKGFWGGNESGSVIIAVMLAFASIIPDKDLALGPFQLFQGHFYDPDKDENKSNTARSNAEKYYNEAIKEYIANNSTNEFIEAVGKMIHYVQDACVPHHAANYYAGVTAHSQFEAYVDVNVDRYIEGLVSLEQSNYTAALSNSVGTIVHNFAKISKAYAPEVKFSLPVTRVDIIATITMRNAVTITAMALYKLSIAAGIPLNK